MNKILDYKDAVKEIKDGMTLMIGGFLACGTPNTMIDALIEQGTKDLTIICNDTSFVDRGLGKLIVNKQVKKVITSHIGTNKETGKQMIDGTLEVVLTPQGTLAEQIRAGGAGLGGILTPTGVGTIVEEGKEVLEIQGKKYILELPLKADVALIYGTQVDEKGNVYYAKTTRNFNPIMAMAAEKVICEAREITPVGSIDPHLVMTPGEIVKMIVKEVQHES